MDLAEMRLSSRRLVVLLFGVCDKGLRRPVRALGALG
jgi:hypothetical protein